MKKMILVMLVALLASAGAMVGAQELEKLEKPEPTVPEIFTLTGEFVRVAYNNEGFVTLGYRLANESTFPNWRIGNEFRARRDAEMAQETGVEMGRWAWSSLFADLNNDGWQDIVVANGFLTADNPDDL